MTHPGVVFLFARFFGVDVYWGTSEPVQSAP